MSDLDSNPRQGVVKGGANEHPLNYVYVLTESWDFDTMHRRAGRDARPKVTPHADSHKYCALGRCGTRPGPYQGGSAQDYKTQKEKILAWRKGKARANRAYLEEKVYGSSK